MKNNYSIKNITGYNILLVISSVMLLSACMSSPSTSIDSTSIESNAIEPSNNNMLFEGANAYSKSTEHTNVFTRCKSTADGMALSATKNKSQAQYLNAAKVYRTCSANHQVSSQDPSKTSLTMRLYVLSTMNFIKGGDLNSAKNMVERFKQRFPQQDFYFANYTSFLDTAEALLHSENTSAQLLATLNISAGLRQELLRKDYWLKN